MKKVTLRFLAILDLIAFEKESAAGRGHEKNYSNNTITGYFDETDIALAKGNYKAVVTDQPE